MKTAYSWLGLGVSVAMFAYLAYKYAVAISNRPAIARADIIFQEWFASGWSLKNILTQFGGVNNCLRLVVTRNQLWVTSWFPFSLFSAFYDLEHVIPLNRITSAETRDGWFSTFILLSYVDEYHETHSLKLRPKNPLGFLRALGIK